MEFGPLTSPATSITAGPDGNVWFAESSPRRIDEPDRPRHAGRRDHRVHHQGRPGSIVAMTTGADGNVWFAKNGFGGPAIGKVDPATGNVTLYSTGLTGAFTLFGGIAAAGDGNVWFTDYSDGLIGRITPAGTISLFGGVLPNVQLNAITAGPRIGGLDTLWVTDPTAKSIAKVTLRRGSRDPRRRRPCDRAGAEAGRCRVAGPFRDDERRHAIADQVGQARAPPT